MNTTQIKLNSLKLKCIEMLKCGSVSYNEPRVSFYRQMGGGLFNEWHNSQDRPPTIYQ